MFLVVWSRQAFDAAADFIRDNPARKREFAAALRQITHQLATDPEGVGESREGELRIMFASELSVFYFVDADEKTVEIAHVRLRDTCRGVLRTSSREFVRASAVARERAAERRGAPLRTGGGWR